MSIRANPTSYYLLYILIKDVSKKVCEKGPVISYVNKYKVCHFKVASYLIVTLFLEAKSNRTCLISHNHMNSY